MLLKEYHPWSCVVWSPKTRKPVSIFSIFSSLAPRFFNLIDALKITKVKTILLNQSLSMINLCLPQRYFFSDNPKSTQVNLPIGFLLREPGRCELLGWPTKIPHLCLFPLDSNVKMELKIWWCTVEKEKRCLPLVFGSVAGSFTHCTPPFCNCCSRMSLSCSYTQRVRRKFCADAKTHKCELCQKKAIISRC